jgi:uncharacterized cupredoxin-like copper-binding protein
MALSELREQANLPSPPDRGGLLLPPGCQTGKGRLAERQSRIESILLWAAIAGTAMTSATVGAVDWAKARLVTVVTVEYRFLPDHLTFRQGVAYQLRVVNRGKELHELTASGFFKTVELRNPGVLNREQTELVLRPGEQKNLYFVAKRQGHYDMRCADHDWAGMTGDITVK